jgi:hypothetical protein
LLPEFHTLNNQSLRELFLLRGDKMAAALKFGSHPDVPLSIFYPFHFRISSIPGGKRIKSKKKLASKAACLIFILKKLTADRK